MVQLLSLGYKPLLDRKNTMYDEFETNDPFLNQGAGEEEEKETAEEEADGEEEEEEELSAAGDIEEEEEI